MQKLKLAAGMLLLTALMAAVVIWRSPYAPVVAPVMEIEEIWAIEDARTESAAPLVTRLENDGMPLAYDAQENTFYCTLGLDHADAWPEIHLTAPDAKGIQLVFVDDYAYDWCADAISEGYAYQILTYSQDAFYYTQIVFTGLPVIMLNAGTHIPPHEDVPAQITFSWPGEEPIEMNARAHRRGATSLALTPKNGFRVEFARNAAGGKCRADVPGVGLTDYVTLLSCSIDPLMIRDKLSWDMYNAFMDEGVPFGHMDTQYVELFVDQDYHGVYLLMKAYDHEQEIALESAQAALADSFYRLVDRPDVATDRPLIRDHRMTGYEQFYAPAGETDFQSIRPFIELIALEDDAEFSRRALKLIDIDSLIRYALFIEACAMTDNEFNNLCIWAHRRGDGVIYRFAPWDLDVSWGVDDGRNSEIWYTFDLFNRMLRLDCGGVVRRRTHEIWQEMREKAFNEANMERFMADYDRALNASGAFYRNAVRWERNHQALDTYEVYSYALSRFEMMDRRIEEIADAQYADRQILVDLYETTDGGPLDDRQRGLDE